MADLTDPLLLQMIAEGRITGELAVEHIDKIKRHRTLGTLSLWLHKRKARVQVGSSTGEIDLKDWIRVFPTGSFEPEEALGRAVNVWIGPPDEVIPIALARKVTVQVRRDKAYVYPMTPGGGSWAIEPVLVVALDEAVLADAIGEALDAAPARWQKSPNFRDADRPDPLRNAGIKSDRGSKLFTLEFRSDITSVLRWHPNRRGGGFVGAETLVSLTSSASTRDLARVIIDALPSTAEK